MHFNTEILVLIKYIETLLKQFGAVCALYELPCQSEDNIYQRRKKRLFVITYYIT